MLIACLCSVFVSSCNRTVSQSIVAPTFSDNPINIKIAGDKSLLGPCEPSICIDPNNNDRIIAGSILDRLHISNDGGKTWENSKLKSPFGVYGDPVVRIDNESNIYFSHLSNPAGKAYASDEFLDRIVVQVSKDDGKTFSDGASPHPNGGIKDQDKQWLYTDAKSGNVLMTWTEFDKYASKEAEDKSRILFSKTMDKGSTWTSPVSISDLEGDCIDDDNTTEGAVPVMDDEGNIFVVWAFNNLLYLDKSTDGGVTWGKDLEIEQQFEGWSLDIPGVNRTNGMPILGIDKSNKKHHGNMYVNWSDQKNGKDDTDIWIIKSTDGGNNWSDRIRVNDDLPGKHQFFSWMDVDPVTGYIYIVFYDRRNHDDTKTDVYLAYSTDGGESFSNKKISESPFTPDNRIFFGDYNDISAYNGMIRPIWTRYEDQSLSVWTALVLIQE